MKKLLISVCSLALALGSLAWADKWDPDEVEKLKPKAEEAKGLLVEKHPDAAEHFANAPGYVIIPTVGKGGIGIGGARGTGLLFEGGSPTAVVTLTQLTIGLQWGGQAYSEFVFFKDQLALDDFKRGNFELGAQASAVAWTAGVSADLDYNGGVAIVTQDKGGLMYEASVGGQKFKLETP